MAKDRKTAVKSIENKSKKKKIIVATSGYFNPLHIGHLDLFKRAKQLGDQLVVIVNNDEQVRAKGSAPFISEKERLKIIRAIKFVDKAVLSIDKDRTVKKTLAKIKPDIFAKGGDSAMENIPEIDLCRKMGTKIIIGLGRKIQSSSWLIKKAAKVKK